MSMNFDLDVYRHVFKSGKPVIISSASEIQGLPLCANWWYKLKPKGKGVCLSFPMRLTPKFHLRKIYVKNDSRFEVRYLPIERLVALYSLSCKCCVLNV